MKTHVHTKRCKDIFETIVSFHKILSKMNIEYLNFKCLIQSFFLSIKMREMFLIKVILC